MPGRLYPQFMAYERSFQGLKAYLVGVMKRYLLTWYLT
jgi:hypothetical protein